GGSRPPPGQRPVNTKPARAWVAPPALTPPPGPPRHPGGGAVALLADAGEGFTPAGIKQDARTVAQAVFERTPDTGTRAQPTTEDFLRTISRTRPTVTTEMALESADHTIRYGRT
ncbi:hypothetical protein ACFXA0_29405, partial [Streptomyces cyaneofuscatus]